MIRINSGAPTAPVEEAVLFAFDDMTLPFRLNHPGSGRTSILHSRSPNAEPAEHSIKAMGSKTHAFLMTFLLVAL